MRYLLMTLAASFACSAPLHAADCRQTGELSGQVKTINVSETLQYGTTNLTVTQDGKIYYSGPGVIIGQVVGQQDNGLPILDHTIYMRDGTQLRTHGDVVEQMTPTGKFENGVPCEFSVVEHITSITANKKLRRLSNDNHDVKATGTISYCSDNNRNQFELAGNVCFQ